MVIAAAILTPFIVSMVIPVKGVGRRFAAELSALAAIPALLLSIFGTDFLIHADFLLLGASFGLDPTRRVFLFLTASVWLIASVFSRKWIGVDDNRSRFYICWLLTMCGNTGLVLSMDMVSFYTFFALMTFAGYGLVIHDGSSKALYAGKIYLIMAILGESLLLAGMILIYEHTGTLLMHEAVAMIPESSRAWLMVILIFAGFGVKTAVFTLHMWLPLSYSEAPVPGSAVLSGPMIKAGILGWMVFLPVGHAEMPVTGSVLVALGLFQAYYGAFIGTVQNNPKAILGYSSISQMGLFTVATGLALQSPAAGTAILPLLALFAITHGFAKSGLFLGYGLIAGFTLKRYVHTAAAVILLILILVIAGVPFTGGAIVKKGIKEFIPGTSGLLMGLPGPLFATAAAATGLVLFRFFICTIRGSHQHKGRMAPVPVLVWIVLAALAIISPLWVSVRLLGEGAIVAGWADIIASLWPPLIGAGIVLLLNRRIESIAVAGVIPAGDLLIPLQRLWNVISARVGMPDPEKFSFNMEPFLRRHIRAEGKSTWSGRIESELKNWAFSGLWLILVLIVLIALVYLFS